jgi:hypothetical protein
VARAPEHLLVLLLAHALAALLDQGTHSTVRSFGDSLSTAPGRLPVDAGTCAIR